MSELDKILEQYSTELEKDFSKALRGITDYIQSTKNLTREEAVERVTRLLPSSYMIGAKYDNLIENIQDLLSSEISDVQTVTAFMEWNKSNIVEFIEIAGVNIRDVVRLAFTKESLDVQKIIANTENYLDKSKGKIYNAINTGIMTVNRTVESQLAEDIGIQWFYYEGNKDKITRPFCLAILQNIHPNTGKKHSKYWHRDEIMSLNNNQIPNVLITGGGYNCRHRWRAVSMKQNRILNNKRG